MSLWVIYAVLAAVAAAAVGVFSKIGIAGVDASVATAIRGVVIAFMMGGIALYFGKITEISSIPSKSLFFIALTGIAGGLSWLWGFLALKLGGEASAVNAIDRLSLVMLVFFAALFLGEHLTWNKILGAILVSVGVFLMTIKPEVLSALVERLRI
jgi:transporter family protein